MYHLLRLCRIKLSSWKLSYNILKLLNTRASEFVFVFYKNMLFGHHLLRKQQRFLFPSDTKQQSSKENVPRRN